MKLFLFDIDGTLLTTDGAGRAALKSAGADLFAIEEDLRTINVSGSTDTAIVQEILQHHSLDVSTANVNRYLGGYLVWLRQHLASLSGAILPGVISLLDVLTQDGHTIGLLTGNVRRGAEIKLTAHGIWDRFSFGAFGDDNSDRNQLGPIAKRRAEASPQSRIRSAGHFCHRRHTQRYRLRPGIWRSCSRRSYGQVFVSQFK